MTQLMKKDRVIRVHVSTEDVEAYDHMIDVLANAVHNTDLVDLELIIADAWGSCNE